MSYTGYLHLLVLLFNVICKKECVRLNNT